jgi:methionyl-tRNA formyltransferase
VKICIAGKNNIAINVVEYLLGQCAIAREDLYVIPHQTSDRERMFQRCFKQYAEVHGLQIVSLEEMYPINDLIFLSLEYAKLIRVEKFASDKLYNLHFSCLPRYKGMYTSVWPILNQDTETGVTLHLIDNGIDTGDIIAQRVFPIDQNETARSLYFKYILQGSKLITDHIGCLLSGSVTLKTQPAQGSSYYAKQSIDYQGALLDLNQVAVSIAAQVRAYSFREYQLPKLNGSEIVDSVILSTRTFSSPGTVLEETSDKLIISTIDYDIALIKDNFAVLLNAAKTKGITGLKGALEQSTMAINHANSKGWTPLIIAAYHANYEAFKLLLEYGADPLSVNANGTSVFMYAKEGYVRTGDDRVFRACCTMSLDPQFQDYKGLTLYDYCRQNNQEHVLEVLKEYYD